MHQYGFLILAAGSSSRLGQPKQLLKFQSTTFLAHCIDIAISVNKGPVLTVLGANAALIKENIDFSGSEVVFNDRWQEGMGTSIAEGMRLLTRNHPDLHGVLIMVCDQPFISVLLLNSLIELHLLPKNNIVASSYRNTLGTPVLFDKSFFKELLELNGSDGAKKIIYANREQVVAQVFPAGEIDIDTAAEYEQLLQRNQ